MTRSEETKLVKDALAKAGINAFVGHGTGTAWGWLHINVGSAEQFGPHVEDEGHSHYYCPACKRIREISDRALKIAQEVTGRHGDYDGEINVYTQKRWDAKLKQAVEIIQPV
jgi:hypothetical protein